MGAVVAVAGEPVQLPDDYHVKKLFVAVLNHALELRAVVCLSGQGPVYVVGENCNAVALCVLHALPELALYEH